MNDYLFDADLAIKNEMVRDIRDSILVKDLINKYEYEHNEI